MVVEEKGGHLQSFFLFLLFLPFVSRSVPRRRSDQKNKQEQKKPQGGTTSLRKHNPHSKMVEYETKWSFGEREKKTRTISLTSMECGFSNELSLGSIVFVLFLFVCFFTGSRFVVSASFFVLLRNYFFYSARTNFQKRNQEEVDWRWICFDFWKMKSMALKTIDEAWPNFTEFFFLSDRFADGGGGFFFFIFCSRGGASRRTTGRPSDDDDGVVGGDDGHRLRRGARPDAALLPGTTPGTRPGALAARPELPVRRARLHQDDAPGGRRLAAGPAQVPPAASVPLHRHRRSGPPFFF